MNIYKLSLILIFLILFSGCETIRNAFRAKAPKAPPLLQTQSPTLEQIITAINRNSMAIRNMTTENGSVLVPGVLIPLHSRLAFERPKRLRIQCSTTAFGTQELDFGSNDTLFWVWVRLLQEKETYYCRHDLFPICPMRSQVPIEPDWIIESIGIIEFMPNDRHEGPVPAGDGNLAVLTWRQTASGQFLKRTIIDSKTGWVVRQEMYSPQNELVAMAVSSDHRYDRGTGILYAKHVEVQCQGASGKMIIDLGTPTFNSSTPFPASMFTMPTFEGYRPVDICGSEFLQTQGTVMPPLFSAPSNSTSPSTPSTFSLPSNSNNSNLPSSSYTIPLPPPVQQPIPEAHIQTVIR